MFSNRMGTTIKKNFEIVAPSPFVILGIEFVCPQRKYFISVAACSYRQFSAPVCIIIVGKLYSLHSTVGAYDNDFLVTVLLFIQTVRGKWTTPV